MICPKCTSAKVEDTKKLERGALVFEAVHISKGVHPHALRYGIEPEESFEGVVWTCEECGFEFYTKPIEEKEEE